MTKIINSLKRAANFQKTLRQKKFLAYTNVFIVLQKKKRNLGKFNFQGQLAIL